MKACLEHSVKEKLPEDASEEMKNLAEKMPDYLMKSKADSTVGKYNSFFNRYQDFMNRNGCSHLPASGLNVSLFITSLLEQNVSINVMNSFVYAIKWAHKLAGYKDPTENSYVVSLLEAGKRLQGKSVTKKDPIDVNSIRELCSKYYTSNELLVVRDIVMILLSFAGFLRFSEVSNLRCKDVVDKGEYFSLNIEKSKTDQYRQGNDILIAKSEKRTCPYSWLSRYFMLAGLAIGEEVYMFRPCFTVKGVCRLIHKNKQLSYTRCREVVISRLREVCPVQLNIGLHSLRAGGASAAARAGVNDRCWKRHGRWKSETAKDGYVEDSVQHRLSVSQSLGL